MILVVAHIARNMNPRTAHSWLYIFLMFTILSFEVIETDGGLMEKFKEWRDRCRQKFEYLRVLYNILTHIRNFPLHSLNRQDFILLNETIEKLIDHKNYDALKKVRWRNRTFMGRMYDFCSRPLSNLTDLMREIKKYKIPEIKPKSRRKSLPSDSKLKRILDSCTHSEYERIPVAPNTLPNPESTTPTNRVKWNWMNFTTQNENGELERVEILLDNVNKANLSTLIHWLYVSEDVTSKMENLKRTGDVQLMKLSFGIVDINDKRDPLQMVESALEFFKDLERRIHRELRKPEKDWNYSVEAEN